jgi:molecular chaperone GrpE
MTKRRKTTKSSTKTLEKRLKEMEKEKNELEELLKHVQADFENYMKRAERDTERKIMEARASLIRELLPVIDSLESALHGDKNKQVEKQLKPIYAQLISILEKQGLKRIESLHKPFDPEVHECVQYARNKQLKDGIIAAELQAGFMFNGILLRASKVKVNKLDG